MSGADVALSRDAGLDLAPLQARRRHYGFLPVVSGAADAAGGCCVGAAGASGDGCNVFTVSAAPALGRIAATGGGGSGGGGAACVGIGGGDVLGPSDSSDVVGAPGIPSPDGGAPSGIAPSGGGVRCVVSTTAIGASGS